MSGSRGWMLSVVVLAFVFARLSGAHLHLCFDGNEPPLEIHTTDSAHVDHHAGSENHDDVDVDPIGDLLAKAGKMGLDEPFMACVVLIGLRSASTQHGPSPRYASHVPRAPPRFLLPPLRAPPLFSIPA